MKSILLLFVFICIGTGSAYGQNQNITNNIMDKFNIVNFNKKNPKEEKKIDTLINGDILESIKLSNGGYQTILKSKLNNYTYLKKYDKNGILEVAVKLLLQNEVGIGFQYDKQGHITKEVNFEKEYPFNIDDYKSLLFKEYNIDIYTYHDIKFMSRFPDQRILKIPVYDIAFHDKNDKKFLFYILVDGRNGKILHTARYPDTFGINPSAYNEYIELLESGEGAKKESWSIFD